MPTTCRLLTIVLVVCATCFAAHAQEYPYHIDTRPSGGMIATGDYLVSPVDAINPVNGALSINIPLAGLPTGPAGMDFDLSLVYNSNLYDIIPVEGGTYSPTLHLLKASDGGGWRYNFKGYRLEQEIRALGFDGSCGSDYAAVMEHERLYRFRIYLPDGSSHILHLLGYADENPDMYWGDGFYGVNMEGLRSPCAASGGRYPQDLLNQTLTWYTADGSFLRLKMSTDGNPINWQSQQWTLFFPDGRRVVGGGQQANVIYDPNDNFVQIDNVTENGVEVTYIKDQFNRSIRIEYGAAPSDATEKEDRITIAGPQGPLEWRVHWQRFQAGSGSSPSTYHCYNDPPVACPLNISHWVVKYVQLPFAAPDFAPPPARPWATYEFAYAATGYGHLGSMRLPSGALLEYDWAKKNGFVAYPFYESDRIVYGGYTARRMTHDQTLDTWQYVYDDDSAEVVNPDGGIIQYSFHDPLPASLGWLKGLVYKVQEPDGTVRKRQWDRNRPAGLSDPLNLAPNNPYIARESITSEPVHGLQRSLITDYLYDKNGNLLSKKEYSWSQYDQNAPMETPLGGPIRVTELSYHVTAPASSDTTFGTDRYWASEAPSRLDAIKRRQVKDGWEGNVLKAAVEFEYDNALANGNVTLERRWDSAKPGCTPVTPLPASCPAFARSYLPDGSGRLEHIYEPAISTHLVYENGPLPTRVDYGSQGTPAYRSFQYDWNVGLGLLNSKTDLMKGTSVTYQYDDYMRLWIEKEANLRQTETRYYPEIRSVWVKRDLRALGDGSLQTVTHTDELGRVDLVRTSDGAPLVVDGDNGIKVKTSYSTFAGGTRIVQSTPYRSTSDLTLEWSCTEKDQLGRVTGIAMFSGPTEPVDCQSPTNRTGITTTDYHRAGNTVARIQVVDPAGKTRDTYFDALGRIQAVNEDPSGLNYWTSYGFDVLDNLTAVFQGEQNRVFVYSSLGRLLSAKNPETGLQPISYTYFDNGNLATRTDGRGITASFTYDELHRIKTKTYSDGTPSVTYTYHGPGANPLNIGELQSVVSAVASSEFLSYDAFGRVISSSQFIAGDSPRNFSYSYWLNDSVQTITNPSQRVIQYDVDDAGRTARVYSVGTIYADLTASGSPYTADGRIAQMKLGNNLWETRQYRTPGTATVFQLGTSQGGGERLELKYHFHSTANNGNLLGHVIQQPNRTWTQNYDYDGVNRLSIASEVGGWSRIYGYDQYGNRWVDPSSTPIDEVHEPVSQSNFDAGTNRLYKADSTYDPLTGNQTYFAPWTLGYDAENRNVTVWSQTNDSGTFAYDGDGRRVKKTWTPSGGSPTTTYYLYNALGQLAAEYSTASSPASTSYIHTDLLGSTRMVTNAAGATLECYDYLPFGRMLSDGINGRNTGCYPPNPDIQISSKLPQKFTGKERDAETRLDYFGARYYSAAQARFMSVDPHNIILEATGPEEFATFLSNPQNWNRYVYVTNGPLITTDPDGRCPLCQFFQQMAIRAMPYADRAAQAVSRWGIRAGQAVSYYGIQGYTYVTRFLTSPAGQEITQGVIETASGYEGPSVTGNIGRLTKAELGTGVRLAQRLGQDISVSEHVGAEFLSAAGKTFDAVGTPEAYKFWDKAAFLGAIDRHLLKSVDFTVVDLTGATKAQALAIQKHVGSLAKELRDKIIFLGD